MTIGDARKRNAPSPAEQVALTEAHTVTVEFDGYGSFGDLTFACHEDGATDPACWLVCSRSECEEGCVLPDQHVADNTGECQVVAWLNNSDDIGCDVINDRTSSPPIPIRYLWHGEGVDWAFAEPAARLAPSGTEAASGWSLDAAFGEAVAWLDALAKDGPDLTVNAHLKAAHEAQELADTPTREEWADVAICLVGVAAHNGWSPAQLARSVVAKVEKNRGRTWHQESDGTWQHSTPAPAPLPVPDLAERLRVQRDWSRETFGPGDRLAGLLDHIHKELVEIEENPTDVTEWIDVVILAFDGAWRAGHEPEAIVAALDAKYTKNRARTWPDWRTADPNAAIEHLPGALLAPTDGGGEQ